MEKTVVDLYQVIVTSDGKYLPQIRERLKGTLLKGGSFYYRNMDAKPHDSYQSAWKLIMDYDCGKI